jgi:hypothetical protein
MAGFCEEQSPFSGDAEDGGWFLENAGIKRNEGDVLMARPSSSASSIVTEKSSRKLSRIDAKPHCYTLYGEDEL